MGKKKRGQKNNKLPGTQTLIVSKKPEPMDRNLIAAFASGRESGIKIGKEEAFYDSLMFFNEIIEESDKNVKGIGPKLKQKLLTYIGDRIEQAVESQKIKTK